MASSSMSRAKEGDAQQQPGVQQQPKQQRQQLQEGPEAKRMRT